MDTERVKPPLEVSRWQRFNEYDPEVDTESGHRYGFTFVEQVSMNTIQKWILKVGSAVRLDRRDEVSMNTIQKWILKDDGASRSCRTDHNISMNTIQKWILKAPVEGDLIDVKCRFNEYDPEVDTAN